MARADVAPTRLVGGVAAVLLALTAAGGCGSDDAGSSRSFCAALRSAPTLESVVAGFTGVDDAELSRRLDRAATAYDHVERTAPDEVGDDVDTVVAVVDAVIDAVRTHPDDRQAAMASVREATGTSPDLAEAATRIAGYAADECDLDLNPGLSSTTTAPPG